MIYQLEQSNFNKVEGLIKNTNHELSIKAVISGSSEGAIYADDVEFPLSTLIFTPECNVVAGKANNKLFNSEIKNKLDFFDSITCDDKEWENNLHEIHRNIAMRKYVRRNYKFDKLIYNNFVENLNNQYTLEYVNVNTLNGLDFENSDKIRDWFKINDLNRYKDYCLGSYIREDKKIISWSLVDCIVGDKIEIGVTTDGNYKKMGLGAIVAAATVSSCISKGIKEIGWHCVDTNIGSIKIAEKVGFKLINKRDTFTPFPPIENVTDLNSEQWAEWATYYEEMNKVQPNYYWLSATCWAKASRMKETIDNIMKLIETDQMWFLQYFAGEEAFDAFKGNEEWENLNIKILKLRG